MYSVVDYGHMAADTVRKDAYARAIARAVRPGDVVVDIGAGTGIFSLLAIRAGAARVHAIDPNPAIRLLPELARENGAEGRIVVHAQSSLDVELPAKADVIVSDLRGVMPVCGDHVAVIVDARRRFLKDGGRLIPQRDVLRVAAVESAPLYGRFREAWESFEDLGLRAAAAKTSILNGVYPDRQAELFHNDVLTTAGTWGTLDYRTCDTSALEETVSLEVVREGVAHGLSVWFDATIFEGIGFSTAPGWSLVYGRFFLPLLEPTRLAMGDRLQVTVRADARGDRWAWETEIADSAGVRRASFRQSTFFGTPATAESILRASGQFQPALSARGRRRLEMVQSFDGSRTVEELALAFATDEPGRPKEAVLRELQELSDRFAE